MTDETCVRHESFGFIRACRVSGHKPLFDSALTHQHYIDITIGTATMRREYYEGRVYPDKELITVSMSEAQFAQFITSMNVGSGAPCTISGMRNEEGKYVSVASPPADINTRETFEKEVKDRGAWLLNKMRKAIDSAQALIEKGKANKTELGEIRSALYSLVQDLESNLPFMMSQFAEGIEKLTERAKMDINAHAVMTGQRMINSTGLIGQTVESINAIAEE